MQNEKQSYFFLVSFLLQFAMYLFLQFSRGHPKIKAIDMLHAADYANMNLQQMEKKKQDSKAKDQKLSKGMK